MEYEIKTTKLNRSTIEDLHGLGTITEYWPDGSVNFEPYDSDCEEEMIAKLDELGIENNLL